MTIERLKKARDLVTRSEYGKVGGKKVLVATVYSSRLLGLEERIEHDVAGMSPSTRSGSRRSAETQSEEKKE